MNSMLKLLSMFRGQKRYASFADMPSWVLALLGSQASFLTFGCSKFVLDVGDPYLKAVDKVGFGSAPALLIGALLLLTAGGGWFYGTLAARCSSLLKDRHFV